jgi:hypothetical protein
MKRRIGRICFWGLLCALLAFASTKSSALDFSFTGNFVHDNDVALFTFTANGTSDVVLQSLSYAGGVNAAGQIIPRGGFDPTLAVFDAAGNLIDLNDDDLTGTVNVDPVTGQAFDVYLDLGSLPAGAYTAALSQYDNKARGPNLSDGFLENGDENFTLKFSGGKPGFFYDATGNQRTGNWAFDILGITSAGGPPPPPSVPDDGLSLVLLSLGAFSLVWARLGVKSNTAVS